MLLERTCSPPPQLLLHELQPSHSLRMQSTSGADWHSSGAASPSLGLQGKVCLTGPMQKAPEPRPYCALLDLRFTPLHDVEQTLQEVHSSNRQSRGSSQGTSSLQNFSSRSKPCGSRPHSLAIFAMRRVLKVEPPSQDTEQGAQVLQAPKCPS